MVKKKTIRQKVRERSAKLSSKEKDNQADGGEVRDAEVEFKPSIKRKLAKQERFLAKLRETQAGLALSKKKPKKRKRSLPELSSLSEFLPDIEKRQVQVKPKKRLNRKDRQNLVLKETKQLAAVLTHPQFRADPYVAVYKHLVNTVPEVTHANPKLQSKKN